LTGVAFSRSLARKFRALMSFSRPRQGVAIAIHPRHIHVAELGNWEERPLEIEAIAEFDRSDLEGLRHWLRERHEKSYVPALVSFHPADRILHRDAIVPRRLAEPEYLPELVREKFSITHAEQWHLHLLHPLEGEPVAAEGAQRPVLFSGISHASVREAQQLLLDLNLMPYRLEVGTLPVIGALFRLNVQRRDTGATVFVEIEEDHTSVALLGKEGVHTPASIKLGYDSIVQAAQREFGLADEAAAREFLRHTPPELETHGRRLLRSLAHDLRPVINSYELTTGQRIGELHCGGLGAETLWIGRYLAASLDLEAYKIDCDQWHSEVGLRAKPGLRLPTQSFGLLTLLAQLETGPDAPAPRPGPFPAPWHADCRLSRELPDDNIVRRHFLVQFLAAAVCLACAVFVAWQVYQLKTLGTGIEFWQKSIQENREQSEALRRARASLAADTLKLDQAYELMQVRVRAGDFVAEIGRSRPPLALFEAVETASGGWTVRGRLQASPEEGSKLLGQYLDALRENPAIGPLFATITLTTMERTADDRELNFSIFFRYPEAHGR